MKRALTIPRATAGSMGAMAITAGMVVTAGTVVVVVTVPPPPATAVPPPPVTTACSREAIGGRERGREEEREREARTSQTGDMVITGNTSHHLDII